MRLSTIPGTVEGTSSGAPPAARSASTDSALDSVTRLAAEVLDAPIALLTTLEGTEEILRSSSGLPERWHRYGRSPIPHALTETVVQSGAPLLIANLLDDGRADGLPEVGGMRVGAYVGVPLRDGDRRVCGVLVALDRVPRRWTPREVGILEDLASVAMRGAGDRLPGGGSDAGAAGALEPGRFLGVIEASLAGFCLVQDDRFLYVNPKFAEIFGYSREEIVDRMRPGDLVTPEDRPRVLANIRKRLDGEWESVQYAFRGVRRDGGIIEAEVLGSRTEAGGRPAVLATLQDATGRRVAAQTRRESEERYRLVARATRSAIRDWDLRTGRCTWNGDSVKLLRYTQGEIGSRIEWWYERIHREDRERVINGVHAVLDGAGESWTDEYRFKKGDGEYSAVMDCCYVTRDERGVPLRVIGSLSDVTERKKAEEVQRFLAEASALLGEDLGLETTLGSVARLTVPTLADYCLIDLVEGGELRRVGLAHIDPVKERILRANERHTLDGDPERHPVIAVIRTGEPMLVTRCTDAMLRSLGHDDHHYRQLVEMDLQSFMIVPLLVRQEVLGVITLAAVGSGRHYTPRDLLVAENLAHRAAQAIEHAQLYRQAREAVRAREEVLGVVSHDLRNPLHTVKLSADFLLEGLEDRRQATVQALEIIQRAAGRMNHLVDDLLDMSSIDAGTFSVDPVPTEVGGLLEEARELFQPLAAGSGVRFHCVVHDDGAPVSLDAAQILRVLSNLVGNGIKFTPRGGTVTLTAEAREGEIRFQVEDTGPGIPADKLTRIFDRFWQGSPGDRRGAGLGLAIARGIVEAHGGRIWAESAEGAGSTVSFVLPARESGGPV